MYELLHAELRVGGRHADGPGDPAGLDDSLLPDDLLHRGDGALRGAAALGTTNRPVFTVDVCDLPSARRVGGRELERTWNRHRRPAVYPRHRHRRFGENVPLGVVRHRLG